MRWALLLAALLISGLLVCVLFQKSKTHSAQTTTLPVIRYEENVVAEKIRSNIPSYVLKTLDYVITQGKAPDSYVGGRIFQNRERRLRQTDSIGQKIIYKEWDVHPKVKGKSRGAERLVTGSDRSAYYTNDHYKSFNQIK